MDIYRLGRVPWQDSQLAYHALAHLGRQGLILCSPAESYVSVGYFQDPEQELDVAHCRRAGLPVFRREVGGGAVYLDRKQIFWQVVLGRYHPLVSINHAAFYRRLLGPVVAAYRALGIEARLAPLNDVAVGDRRISGTGAGEIGDGVVFVGNLMRRFDCAAMARVIKAPDQAFRRRFHDHMECQLTSLSRELGPEQEAALADEQLYDLLAREFAQVLGTLEPRPLDDQLRRTMDRLGQRMLSPAWTYFPRRPKIHRKVKVRAGLFLHHWERRSGQGRVKAQFTSLDGKVVEVLYLGNGRELPLSLGAGCLSASVADFTKALETMVGCRRLISHDPNLSRPLVD
jgi:lipoate-protein ligase A